MSWFSQFAHDFVDGFLGAPPSKLPTPSTPVHQALIAADTAVNQVASAVSSVATSAVDDYLTTKIGPVGATLVNTALQALIAEAESRLAPTAVVQQAQPAAA